MTDIECRICGDEFEEEDTLVVLNEYVAIALGDTLVFGENSHSEEYVHTDCLYDKTNDL